MDRYDVIVVVALIAFCLVAYLLLAPVYRFLKREEKASERWTPEEVARRMREKPPANGHQDQEKSG